MTVTLTPEQEKFVAEQVKSGHYHSVDDVITQGLGMLRAQEEFIRSNVAELREKLDVGLDQLRRREVVDGREAIGRLLEKNRHRLRSQ